jgi:hypothetical protein
LPPTEILEQGKTSTVGPLNPDTTNTLNLHTYVQRQMTYRYFTRLSPLTFEMSSMVKVHLISSDILNFDLRMLRMRVVKAEKKILKQASTEARAGFDIGQLVIQVFEQHV